MQAPSVFDAVALATLRAFLVSKETVVKVENIYGEGIAQKVGEFST